MPLFNITKRRRLGTYAIKIEPQIKDDPTPKHEFTSLSPHPPIKTEPGKAIKKEEPSLKTENAKARTASLTPSRVGELASQSQGQGNTMKSQGDDKSASSAGKELRVEEEKEEESLSPPRATGNGDGDGNVAIVTVTLPHRGSEKSAVAGMRGSGISVVDSAGTKPQPQPQDANPATSPTVSTTDESATATAIASTTITPATHDRKVPSTTLPTVLQSPTPSKTLPQTPSHSPVPRLPTLPAFPQLESSPDVLRTVPRPSATATATAPQAKISGSAQILFPNPRTVLPSTTPRALFRSDVATLVGRKVGNEVGGKPAGHAVKALQTSVCVPNCPSTRTPTGNDNLASRDPVGHGVGGPGGGVTAVSSRGGEVAYIDVGASGVEAEVGAAAEPELPRVPYRAITDAAEADTPDDEEDEDEYADGKPPHIFGPQSEFNSHHISKLLCLPSSKSLSRAYTTPTFEAALFAYLSHTSKLGAHMIQLFHCLSARSISCTKTPEIRAILSASLKHDGKMTKFLSLAWDAELNRDKFHPWRACSPSAVAIRGQSAAALAGERKTFLFQLLVWRVWGFGRPGVIGRLADVTGVEDTLRVLEEIDGELGRDLVMVPAYGQYVVQKGRREAVLRSGLTFVDRLDEAISNAEARGEGGDGDARGVWGGREAEADDLDASHSSPAKVPPSTSSTIENPVVPKAQAKGSGSRETKGMLSFHEVLTLLSRHPVTCVPSTGLVAWLYVSDLIEYSLCQSATIPDLVSKLLFKGPGACPGAFKAVSDGTGLPIPPEFSTREGLGGVLGRVLGHLKSRWDGKCVELQGREYGVVDLEHMLCKVAREARAKGEVLRPPRKMPRKRDRAEVKREDAQLDQALVGDVAGVVAGREVEDGDGVADPEVVCGADGAHV